MSRLIIYYDNPNEPSDMYLKWLKNDCEKMNIEYNIVENYDMLLEEFRRDKDIKVLPMLPLEDERVFGFLRMNDYVDIDNVGKSGLYTSATAQGIYNYIVENYPDREYTSIAVIGRGTVGKELIDLLIKYGYTVYEFNSKSHVLEMYSICKEWADIIVGLATGEIFNKANCAMINNYCSGNRLIDAGNCFNTTDKLKCGKWTREVLLSRV